MAHDEPVTKNAIIESAEITNDDHGLLSAWLTLDYGGTGQGFGGYSLYLPKSFTHHTLESPAGHFIFRVMEIAGVSKWSDLRGKTIRAKCTWGEVKAIGHIVKDDWFCPSDDFAALRKERDSENDRRLPQAQAHRDRAAKGELPGAGRTQEEAG